MTQKYSGDNSTDKPNILLVMTDQEPTYLMGCYGNEIIETPARDSILWKEVLPFAEENGNLFLIAV